MSEPVVVPVVADGSSPVTVGEVALELLEGDKVFLSTPFFAVQAGSWGSGLPTNVGVTAAIYVKNSSGETLLWATSAENYTPTAPRIYPKVQTLFTAPCPGTFTATLKLFAYSTDWASGMVARVLGDPAILCQDVSEDDWSTHGQTAPVPIATGATSTEVLATVPACYENMTVSGDMEVTVDVFTPELTGVGSVVEAWLEIQPVNASGVPVGGAYVGPKVTQTISEAKHHGMFHPEVAGYIPSTATAARVSRKIRVVSGNSVVSEGGYNYTHVVIMR